MDQVRHLNPAIDYSMITLDTHWDPKANRIYNPKAESQERSKLVVEDQLELVVEVQLGAGSQLEPRRSSPGWSSGVWYIRFSVALWVIFVLLYIRAPGLFGIFV
ncbi:hypothetical protein PIB30_034910 [Stylosanthes scabra]|uniref:Uncharacterized protein n=1 Tax=Stylosanthes scabra TaxID=79078 RepID=A0ABU6TCQ1_9FABA|nr:hypothetical protein [Stylosanthes scabra]